MADEQRAAMIGETAEYICQKNKPPDIRCQLYEQLNRRGVKNNGNAITREVIVNIAEDALTYGDPSITIENVFDRIVLPDGWL